METQKSLLTRGLWATRKYTLQKILQTNTTYLKTAGRWERTCLQIRLNRLKWLYEETCGSWQAKNVFRSAFLG